MLRLVFLLVCCLMTGLAAQTRYSDNVRITEIKISGVQRIDEDAILLLMQTRKNAYLNADILNDDIKRIYRTRFFDQVNTRLQDNTLIVDLVEKPIVRKFLVRGNDEISEKDLGEVLRLGDDRFLDLHVVSGLIKSAVSMYQQRGFYDAHIRYNVVPATNNQVDLVFEVDEGERYRIASIKFNGLNEVDPDDLKEVMETRERVWWKSWITGTGRLNDELLKIDTQRVKQYLFDNGYVQATVSSPTISKLGDERLEIAFDVDEGKLFTVGSISVEGDLINGSTEETLEGTGLAVGEVFKGITAREDVFLISDKFEDAGHAFVNVEPKTSLNNDGTIDLKYVVDKGGLVNVRRVNITGNDKTYDNVIRREVLLREGELFSGRNFKRSEVVLKRSGYFQEVNVSKIPTGRPDEIDVDVNVREGQTGSFSFGGGYSSFDGVLFNANVSEQNFLGTGRSVNLNVDTGSFRDDVSLSVVDPRIGDSFVRAGVNAVYSQRNFFDFNRNQTGGGLLFGYPFEQILGRNFEDINGNLAFDFYENEILDVNDTSAASFVVDSVGKYSTFAVTPSLVSNTIDNPLNPTKGWLHRLNMEVATPVGSREYYIFEAYQSVYQPLLHTSVGDFTFAMRTRLSYGDTLGNADGPVGDRLPLFKRFFPGGINSVRGYRNRFLGPVDDQGRQYGGSKQFVNNLEMIFPLVNSAGLKGVVFFDAGQAFDDDQGIKLGDLRQAYGAGFRWSSPLGPIRVEFGMPIDRQANEKSLVTQFSFGAPL